VNNGLNECDMRRRPYRSEKNDRKEVLLTDYQVPNGFDDRVMRSFHSDKEIAVK